jgi:hypothetical protein
MNSKESESMTPPISAADSPPSPVALGLDSGPSMNRFEIQESVIKQPAALTSNSSRSLQGTRTGLRLIELGFWLFMAGIFFTLAFCNSSYLGIHSLSWLVRIAVWLSATASLLVTLAGLGFCFSVPSKIVKGRLLIGGAILLAVGFVFFIMFSRSIGRLPTDTSSLLVNATTNIEAIIVAGGIAQFFCSLGLIAEFCRRIAYFVYRDDLAESFQKDQILVLVSGVATLLTVGIYVMQDRLINRMGEEKASNVINFIIGFCVVVGVFTLVRMSLAIRHLVRST